MSLFAFYIFSLCFKHLQYHIILINLPIGKSSINMVLHEFVFPMNVAFRIQIYWPWGEESSQVMVGSKDQCGLMFVHSAINCTQIHILKPNGVFSSNYYSYKSKVHNMQLQAMVDHHKCFCNVFVKLSKSMNNSKIL